MNSNLTFTGRPVAEAALSQECEFSCCESQLKKRVDGETSALAASYRWLHRSSADEAIIAIARDGESSTFLQCGLEREDCGPGMLGYDHDLDEPIIRLLNDNPALR